MNCIEKTSKKDQKIARERAVYAYNNRRWTYDSIWKAYEKPSNAKVRAWDYCKELCRENNGHDLIITARNCMKFSAVFKFEDENGDLCYCYITKDYDRFCKA